MSIWWMIGGFILVLTPIIIIHELGHFFTARRFHIRVEEFGIGFPPRAATLFERGGTLYTLNWIPVGGFVRPAGEDDPNVPGGLASASKIARFSVLVAGSAANFILAFFILWGAFLLGPPIYDEARIAVSSVFADSPAQAAGFQANDVFVSLDGAPVTNTDDLVHTIRTHAGQALTVVVERAGQPVTLSVTPQLNDADDPASGSIGTGLTNPPTGERESLTPGAAAVESLDTMWRVLALTVKAPGMLIRGELTAEEARPIGVVGMSQVIGFQAQSRDWFGLLFFAGLISVGLGFTNLLPLPALDGGRILFVLIEAVRGRRIEPEREGMVHLVGMLLLLGLMALLIVQDIVNPVIPF